MKEIIGIIILATLTNISYGQILNGDFDEWILIDTLGQPYEDLVDWETNNIHLGNGFATTPNLEIFENNETGVSITTNHQGIDGLSSGRIWQTINANNLYEISYLSKCDSIFESGACVVNVFDSSNNLIYSDSINQTEQIYTTKSINVNELDIGTTDQVTIEFVAFGQIGEFEEFQAYSEFKLLYVDSFYTSNILQSNEIETAIAYPNPFSDFITIETKSDTPITYSLYDLAGRLLKVGSDKIINTGHLSNGKYILKIIDEKDISILQIVKK